MKRDYLPAWAFTVVLAASVFFTVVEFAVGNWPIGVFGVFAVLIWAPLTVAIWKDVIRWYR